MSEPSLACSTSFGPATIFAVRADPAGCEFDLLHILAAGIDDDPHQPAALELVTVPGAVLGEDDVVLVIGRELIAGIELHARAEPRARRA